MTRLCRTALLVALAASAPAAAQEEGRYRDFKLGASVAAVSALTQTRSADVTVVHERPAVMQELRWIPSSFGTAGRSHGAGLQQIVFSFYENQLYRLMIDYERSQTKGMTDRDVVDAVSAMYGQPSSSKIADGGTDTWNTESVAARVVARWNGPGYAVAVSRWAYGGAWRLVVESTPLAALARTADARALVLDVQEGPQREADRARREKQGKDDAEAAARSANKATFQP
ncbi:MAG TPA: hypothetical protein VGJ78_20640 [Vicinamibacterales bacterium]|jgi:hypothetical protein